MLLRTAQLWHHVDYLDMRSVIRVRCNLSLDLKDGTWETHKRYRVIPFLHRDVITVRIILSRALSPMECQGGILMASESREAWTLHVIGEE